MNFFNWLFQDRTPPIGPDPKTSDIERQVAAIQAQLNEVSESQKKIVSVTQIAFNSLVVVATLIVGYNIVRTVWLDERQKEDLMKEIRTGLQQTTDKVEAKLKEVEDGLGEFNNFRQMASTNITEFQSVITIWKLIAEAQSDGVEAFFALRTMSFATNDPNAQLAKRAMNSILLRLELDRASTSTLSADPWQGTSVQAATATIQDYADRLMKGNISLPQRIALIRNFYSDQRFTTDERVTFLVLAMKTAVSLRVLDQAMILLNQEAKLNKTIIAVEQYYDWFDQRSLAACRT